MRIFKSHWWNPIAILAVILSLLIAMAITTTGLKLLIFVAHLLFPKTIEISSVEGTLTGPLHLKQIKLHIKNTDIKIEELDIDWELQSLLANNIHIKRIVLIKPYITINSSTNAPNSIHHDSESSLSLDKIILLLKNLYRKFTIDTLLINQLDIQREEQHIRVEGHLNEQWNMSWTIDAFPIHVIDTNVQGYLQANGMIKGSRLEPQITADMQLPNAVIYNNKIKMLSAQMQIKTSLKQDAILKLLQFAMQSNDIISADQKIPQLKADFIVTAINNGYKGLLRTNTTTLQQKSLIKLPKIISIPATESLFYWNSSGLQAQFSTKDTINTINANLLFPNLDRLSGLSDILKQPIRANLKAELASIQLLQPFFPGWKIISGKLKSQMDIKGTLNKPDVVGYGFIQNAKLFLPDFNVLLNDIQLEAQGNSLHKIAIKGHALSDGGNVDLLGTASLENFEPSAVLTLKGNNFLIYNTPRYQIYASPTIEIQISEKLLKLTGAITIPKARLLPTEVSNDVITLPSEIEIIGEKTSPNETSSIPMNTDFQLNLGKNITLKLLGLTGRVEGSLHIMSAPENPTLASGELSIVDGLYEAYGQKLMIRKGARLTFAHSPIDDPTLYLQAVKTINTVISNNTQATVIANTLFNTPASSTLSLPPQSTEIIVGITVKGKIHNPELSLFSEPSTFSQSDILSLMLLNQPLDQVSATDAQLLLKAATALSPSGGQLSHIINQIQQTFGVDELNVTSIPQLTPGSSTITKNTSVVIGKRLSRRLYINYSYGLTAPLNILKISYLIGSKWKLQTESSDNANAVDLFYTIEKN